MASCFSISRRESEDEEREEDSFGVGESRHLDGFVIG